MPGIASSPRTPSTPLAVALGCALWVVLLGCQGGGATAPPVPAPSPAVVDSSSKPTTETRGAAAALAPTPAVAVEPWVWQSPVGPVQGDVYATQHFRLYTTSRQESSVRRSLPVFYETALEHYTTEICQLPEPPKPLETYVFGTRDQWADYTKLRLGEDAGTYLALQRGGYTLDSQAVLFDLGRWDTLALAAHEGWHQYTQATFRHPLPIWLEEGLATYMEGHRWDRGQERPLFAPWRNMERFGALREANRDDELIPLEQLLEGMPQAFLRRDGQSKLLTYYAQVWCLTHYLADGEEGRYREALAELLRDAVAGRIASKVATSERLPRHLRNAPAAKLGKALVLVYFNPDFAEFEAGYEAFQTALLARGAGDYIWRGEDPVKGLAKRGAKAPN